VEHELLRADEHRVAGVVAALIARHKIKTVRKKVDNLALAFVSPIANPAR
jgi:hypothetical protein